MGRTSYKYQVACRPQLNNRIGTFSYTHTAACALFLIDDSNSILQMDSVIHTDHLNAIAKSKAGVAAFATALIKGIAGRTGLRATIFHGVTGGVAISPAPDNSRHPLYIGKLHPQGFH